MTLNLIDAARRALRRAGYGVQSPTDYRFVRHVLCMKMPYYAYNSLTKGRSRREARLGRLLLRLSNELKPQTALDSLGMGDCIKAGCRRCQVWQEQLPDTPAETGPDMGEARFDLAVVHIETPLPQLFAAMRTEGAVVVEGINRHRPLWRVIASQPRAVISYDMGRWGVVLLDRKRARAAYEI